MMKNNSEHRPLRTMKRLLRKMKNDKQRLSFYLVISFFLISLMVVIMDILCVDGSYSYDMAKANSSHLPDSEDDTKVWETAPPLGIPLYRRNLRLYSSTLDSKVVSRKEKFESSLVARQEEMQQLIRNISASMSKNPLVRQIQASRAK